MAGISPSLLPHQVQIMVTERCNLRCKHCAVPEEDSPAEHELDLPEWKRVIQWLATAGICDLAISGGEVFLRHDILELALFAHVQGIGRTTITTNMTLITPPLADEIAVAQQRFPNFGIQVSIDGASPETHDWMRGRGTFKVLLRNVNRLRTHGGRVTGLNCVIHRGNFHEAELLVQLATDLGADNLRFFPIGDIGRGINLSEWNLTPKQWRYIFTALPGWQEKSGLDILCVGPILSELHRGADGQVPGALAEVVSRYCVGPDGDFFVCPPLRTRSLGNVTMIAEPDRWQIALEQADQLRQEHCPTCPFLLLCVGVDPRRPLRPALEPYVIRYPQIWKPIQLEPEPIG